MNTIIDLIYWFCVGAVIGYSLPKLNKSKDEIIDKLLYVNTKLGLQENSLTIKAENNKLKRKVEELKRQLKNVSDRKESEKDK